MGDRAELERPRIGPEMARGILIAALGVLAGFYSIVS
jgi:hypothetical protein